MEWRGKEGTVGVVAVQQRRSESPSQQELFIWSVRAHAAHYFSSCPHVNIQAIMHFAVLQTFFYRKRIWTVCNGCLHCNDTCCPAETENLKNDLHLVLLSGCWIKMALSVHAVYRTVFSFSLKTMCSVKKKKEKEKKHGVTAPCKVNKNSELDMNKQ